MHYLLFTWDEDVRSNCEEQGYGVKTLCNLNVPPEQATLEENKVTCEKCRKRLIDPLQRVCLMI